MSDMEQTRDLAHASDCAVNNMPAMAAGPCDCGADLRARLAAAVSKSDAEMERVKACEHIALGDEGWEVLRNLCPSTAAVAWLRDQFAAAEAREAVLVFALEEAGATTRRSPLETGFNHSPASVRELQVRLAEINNHCQAALANASEGARRLLDVVEAARAEVALWRQPDEGWNEAFERVAELFYRDTGLLRPGKSLPSVLDSDGMDERRKAAWDLWRNKFSAALIAAIARLTSPRDGADG